MKLIMTTGTAIEHIYGPLTKAADEAPITLKDGTVVIGYYSHDGTRFEKFVHPDLIHVRWYQLTDDD